MNAHLFELNLRFTSIRFLCKAPIAVSFLMYLGLCLLHLPISNENNPSQNLQGLCVRPILQLVQIFQLHSFLHLTISLLVYWLLSPPRRTYCSLTLHRRFWIWCEPCLGLFVRIRVQLF